MMDEAFYLWSQVAPIPHGIGVGDGGMTPPRAKEQE